VVIDSLSLYRHIQNIQREDEKSSEGRGEGGIKEKKTNKDISNRRKKERVYIGYIVRCPI
jgi:hypothetical protein